MSRIRGCMNFIIGIISIGVVIACGVIIFANGDDDSKKSSDAISESSGSSSTAKVTRKPDSTSRPSRTPSPKPTSTSTPSATPMPTPVAYAVVLRTSNFRSGPGVNYEIVGGAEQGYELPISGRNDDGTWLQISSAEPLWIWVELVERSFEVEAIPILPTLKPTDIAAPTRTPNFAGTERAASLSRTATAQAANTSSLPSTDRELEALIKDRLANYDYVEQRIAVAGLEFIGDELVIYLKRYGSPNGNDYFGQLGTIDSVIAESDLDVESVRTFDVDGRNGFVVQLNDLLSFRNGRIDFEEYRSRWGFFEP